MARLSVKLKLISVSRQVFSAERNVLASEKNNSDEMRDDLCNARSADEAGESEPAWTNPSEPNRRPRRLRGEPRRRKAAIRSSWQRIRCDQQPERSTPLVSRLIGLETEYATLVADNEGLRRDDLPPSHLVYMQLCEAIRRDQPTVGGLYDHEQMFLANGGAVTFESHPTLHALPGGLIELATPEVRGPEELLNCQRSIDQLIADAADEIGLSIDLRILKNSSDAFGHVYGCQENYEVDVASGFWLVIYRLFVGLLWVMQTVSLLISFPLLAGVFSVMFLMRFLKGAGSSDANEPSDVFRLVPPWGARAMIRILRLIHLPTVFVLRFVARHVAFRRERKYLTAMLISRVALCGSGDIDSNGCYRMSAKAMSIDSLADMGGFRGERPIFVYGHWLGQFCAKSFMSLASTRQMFRKRQRLQIGLSDSNLADMAEYVKVGSVSLVLDMIESGSVENLPLIRRPIESLHRLARDWDLIATIPTSQGEMSAIDIQRAYLKAAEDFVATTPRNWRGESMVVLSRWRELIEAVSAFRLDANDTEASIGRVDWLTKRWMIDQLGGKADWAARKKVDLRYHELSQDGYFHQLVETYPEITIVDEEQVRRRRRSPPPSSPAARRGWLIREFADSEERLRAEWSHAMIGRGRNRRRVDFAETGQP